MKNKEHLLAHLWLDGLQGLEIGASAHNAFGLKTRNVAALDEYERFAAEERRKGEVPVAVDIWALADALPVPDDHEDFVLSSHVVEHLPNLVGAFLEWNRVTRAGGYIFMIVPLRDALPPDAVRPITPLAHFIEDFRQQATPDTHPFEDVPSGRLGHYHVFTPDSLLKVVRWMRDQGLCNWQLVAREDIDSKVGNGFTLVFRVVSKTVESEIPTTCKRPRTHAALTSGVFPPGSRRRYAYLAFRRPVLWWGNHLRFLRKWLRRCLNLIASLPALPSRPT
jgi:SAM-dependent methyltransferase